MDEKKRVNLGQVLNLAILKVSESECRVNAVWDSALWAAMSSDDRVELEDCVDQVVSIVFPFVQVGKC